MISNERCQNDQIMQSSELKLFPDRGITLKQAPLIDVTELSTLLAFLFTNDLCDVIGICNTIGRVLSGFITFIPNVSPLFVNNVCITLSGVSVVFIPLCTTYTTMMISIAAYGLLSGKYVLLASTVYVLVLLCLVGLLVSFPFTIHVHDMTHVD